MNAKKKITTTPEQTKRFLDLLLEEGIKPLAKEIATIHLNGDVAVLFFDVGTGDDAVATAAQSAATKMGWTGKRVELGAMNKTAAARLADSLASYAPTDPAVAWFRSRKSGRIFVCSGSGTFCVNHNTATGFSFEPGTLGFVPGEGQGLS